MKAGAKGAVKTKGEIMNEDFLVEVYEDENGEIHYMNAGNLGKHTMHGSNKPWKKIGRCALEIIQPKKLAREEVPLTGVTIVWLEHS